MEEKTLIEARRKAEKVVSDMTDPDLKVKAFEVIFQKLLATDKEPASQRPNGKKAKKRTGSSTRSASGADQDSKRGRIRQIRDAGFFQQPRTIAEVRDELRNHGWIYKMTSLSGPLQKLVQHGELRRAAGDKGKFNYVNP